MISVLTFAEKFNSSRQAVYSVRRGVFADSFAFGFVVRPGILFTCSIFKLCQCECSNRTQKVASILSPSPATAGNHFSKLPVHMMRSINARPTCHPGGVRLLNNKEAAIIGYVIMPNHCICWLIFPPIFLLTIIRLCCLIS